jgi:hypothetical protein
MCLPCLGPPAAGAFPASGPMFPPSVSIFRALFAYVLYKFLRVVLIYFHFSFVFPFVYQSMSDDVVKILSIALDDSFLVKRDPCEDLCSVFFQCSLSMIQVSALFEIINLLSTLHIYVLRVPF